jgi:hypothetical protein
MENALADLLSRDGSRIWRAAGAVMASRDREKLRALAAERAAIQAAVEGVGLGGALRPNATHLSFALDKLVFSLGGACFCELYLTYDMFYPDREEERGHVEVISDEMGDWTTVTVVRCTDCGQEYRVTQEFGGHYVTARWETAA